MAAHSDKLLRAVQEGLVGPLRPLGFRATGRGSARGETVECTNGSVLITLSADWLEGELKVTVTRPGQPAVPLDALIKLQGKAIRLNRLPRSVSIGTLESMLRKIAAALLEQSPQLLANVNGSTRDADRVDHNRERSYDSAFPVLGHVYLEGSWVLRLDPANRAVAFTLETVLTQAHVRYHPPRPGEQYCYERAVLTLSSLSPVAYQLSGAMPHHDPSGIDDFGNIDTFRECGSNVWELTGDWGLLTIVNPLVSLTLEEPTI